MSDPVSRLNAALEGRYSIERELGEGGMATVYLAEDLKHNRKVAVKVLRPDLAATLGPERFLREIEIAANLTHPHILPLYDSGEANGFLFYVMPYIEGESLRDRLEREGELPVSEAVRILRDVVDALAHAHDHDVVHRDIKPDNVMLSGRHALVTDFGVAKAVSQATGQHQLTTIGVALGTPAYMAPEQAEASDHIDHRADIYAVGALAYELLAGAPPFSGKSPQMTLMAHVTEAPKPVTEHRAAVPMALSQLIMRCLEKKPADRWQSAEEMLAHLEALVTPSGGITPTHTMPIAGVPGRQRLSPALVTTVAVGVAVLGFIGWASLPGSRSSAGETAATNANPGGALASQGPVGTLNLVTIPDGAEVRITRLLSEALGEVPASPSVVLSAPVEGLSLSEGEYFLEFVHSGSTSLGFTVNVVAEEVLSRSVTLTPTSALTSGMVAVDEGVLLSDPLGLLVDGFLIDQTEVTNEQFGRFVQDGGYGELSLWPETLWMRGALLSGQDALAQFVDETGIPGPRNWSGSIYPPGEGQLPVTSLVWYEADAYCRWAGKRLPSFHQWWRAALGNTDYQYPWGMNDTDIEVRANFNLRQAMPVGSHPTGASGFGVLDLAGNAREWLALERSDDTQALAVGGSWQEPSYTFDPIWRELLPLGLSSPNTGFRCVRITG